MKRLSLAKCVTIGVSKQIVVKSYNTFNRQNSWVYIDTENKGLKYGLKNITPSM